MMFVSWFCPVLSCPILSYLIVSYSIPIYPDLIPFPCHLSVQDFPILYKPSDLPLFHAMLVCECSWENIHVRTVSSAPGNGVEKSWVFSAIRFLKCPLRGLSRTTHCVGLVFILPSTGHPCWLPALSWQWGSARASHEEVLPMV